MPLPAADETKPQDVQKYKAAALGSAVVESSMKAREEGFSLLDFSNDGLSVGGDEMGCAHCDSAYAEAIVREGVGQNSCVESKVVAAINNGFWFVDMEIVKLQCVGVIR